MLLETFPTGSDGPMTFTESQIVGILKKGKTIRREQH
jgi:hypothetical protein